MKYFLYTKGSCDNRSAYREGAYAFILLDEQKNVVKQFSKGTIGSTNNIASLKAIVEGCRAVPEKNAEVIVFSDNQYAINILSGFWTASANRDLLDRHRLDRKRLNIHYKWINNKEKAKFNTLAISLVNAATEEMRLTHNINKRESHKIFKKYYKK